MTVKGTKLPKVLGSFDSVSWEGSMKRIFAWCLAGVMACMLFGCRQQTAVEPVSTAEPAATTAAEEPAATATETPAEPEHLIREEAVKQIIYMIGSNSFRDVAPADLTAYADAGALSDGCGAYMAIAVGGGYLTADGALDAGGTLSHAEARALLSVDERLAAAADALPNDAEPLTQDELDALLTAVDSALTDVRLQDDFFLYTNRVTLRNHYVDDEHTEWSQYGETGATVKARETAMLDALTASDAYAEDTPEYRVKKTVALLNDTDARNAAGAAALQPYFDRIDACTDIASFITVSAQITRETGSSPFFWIRGTNDKATNGYYLYLSSMTLGIAGLTDDPAPYMDGYCALLCDLFAAAGMAADADAVRAMVEMQNLTATDTPFDAACEYITYVISVADLDKVMTNMDVAGYLDTLGLSTETVMIENYNYYRLLNACLIEKNLESFKLIAKQDLLLNGAAYLSEEIAAKSDAISGCFDAIIMGDAPETATAAKDGYVCAYAGLDSAGTVEYLKNFFGHDLPQAYANAYVSAETEKRLTDMTDTLIATLRKRLEANDWLSDSTRAAAIDKLDHITVNLVKPTYYAHPTDFATLVSAYFSCKGLALQNDIAACNDPAVYKKHWRMLADEANACYLPECNSINIPSGILMWPFAADGMSDAQLYGAIGAVIGHELTHGFDEQGSQYDKNGLLVNWWTDADRTVFEQKQKTIEDYYAKWPYRAGKVQDPAVTISETVADLGGLAMVMEILDGDTDAQAAALTQFSYVWAETATDAGLDKLATTDVHPTKRVRVNAAMAALPEFYACFGVTEGDGMYYAPENRVSLW